MEFLDSDNGVFPGQDLESVQEPTVSLSGSPGVDLVISGARQTQFDWKCQLRGRRKDERKEHNEHYDDAGSFEEILMVLPQENSEYDNENDSHQLASGDAINLREEPMPVGNGE